MSFCVCDSHIRDYIPNNFVNCEISHLGSCVTDDDNGYQLVKVVCLRDCDPGVGYFEHIVYYFINTMSVRMIFSYITTSMNNVWNRKVRNHPDAGAEFSLTPIVNNDGRVGVRYAVENDNGSSVIWDVFLSGKIETTTHIGNSSVEQTINIPRQLAVDLNNEFR